MTENERTNVVGFLNPQKDPLFSQNYQPISLLSFLIQVADSEG